MTKAIVEREYSQEVPISLEQAVTVLNRIVNVDPKTITSKENLAQTMDGFVDASKIVADELVLKMPIGDGNNPSRMHTRYWGGIREGEIRHELNVAYLKDCYLSRQQKQLPSSFNLSIYKNPHHAFNFFLKTHDSGGELHFVVEGHFYKENGYVMLDRDVYFYPAFDSYVKEALVDHTSKPEYPVNMAAAVKEASKYLLSGLKEGDQHKNKKGIRQHLLRLISR